MLSVFCLNQKQCVYDVKLPEGKGVVTHVSLPFNRHCEVSQVSVSQGSAVWGLLAWGLLAWGRAHEPSCHCVSAFVLFLVTIQSAQSLNSCYTPTTWL